MTDPQTSGGARISLHDRRVTAAVNWLWGLIAMGFVTCLGLAAKNLYDLNVNMALVLQVAADSRDQLTDHEQRIRRLEEHRRGH